MYDYTLHEKAIEVVEYFKNHPIQSDAGYLLPILFSRHNTQRKIKSRIHDMLSNLNEDLAAMAKSVGWERKFTSYSLRHGFATHLRNNNVGISKIKEALGHETEEQTAVYLDELDDKDLTDEINRALNFEKDKPGKKNKKRGLRL